MAGLASMMHGASVRRFDDLNALSRAAADELTALVIDTVAARGSCHIALSGGSTPERLFRLLAQRGRNSVPWEHVELWWGDERTVPPDHAESNYRMAREALIEPLGLDAARVHRIAGELDPDAAARSYEHALVAALGSRDISAPASPPALDLVLLGMGPDGHTASLFPHSPALDATTRWVVANPVDSPFAHGATTRITMTALVLNAARHIRFLVAGADKAAALAQVLEGAPDPRRYPAQLVAPRAGDLVWLVDAAAATALRGVA